MIEQWQLILFGGVQGVGLRYAVKEWATRLGIAGYVRNQDDGTVEIVIQAEEWIIQQFFDHLRDMEPAADIQKINKKRMDTKVLFDKFEILL